MKLMGVQLEELEISALLKVSAKREDKYYMYLHKLRNAVRCVSSDTGELVKNWFNSDVALEAGRLEWDESEIKEADFRNGGGWHGQGWLGKGKWEVYTTSVSQDGFCHYCGERLACVDLDVVDTAKFADSISSLALKRETELNFREFQVWLESHSDYKFMVDGANIGLYQQNFADGGFSILQLNTIVKELYEISQGKWPLVILHRKRVRALMENTSSRKILEEWIAHDALYTTPHGSNDDWYWLYAAVKFKCLLVTNDEMRDHTFELLGSSFFVKWKEQHQVRFTFVKGDLKLRMPSPYSLFIQESTKGPWHVPITGDYVDEISRPWLCITRESHKQYLETLISSQQNDNTSHTASETDVSEENQNISSKNEQPRFMVGERKEGSPPTDDRIAIF